MEAVKPVLKELLLSRKGTALSRLILLKLVEEVMAGRVARVGEVFTQDLEFGVL